MVTRTLGVSRCSVVVSPIAMVAAAPRIVESARSRDLTTVRALLTHAVGLHAPQHHCAAFPVDLGAAIDAASEKGTTALPGAAYRGHDPAARYLVDQGAAVIPINTNARTPLDLTEGEYPHATYRIHQSTAELLRKPGGTSSPRARQDLGMSVKSMGC